MTVHGFFYSTDETLYETSYLLARRRRYRYDVWCKMPGVPGKRPENPPEDWPTPGFVISDILRDWKDEMMERLKENHKSCKPFKLRQAFEAYLHQVTFIHGSVLMRFRAKVQCCEKWCS